jgi:glycosyltransferase involved in cell wall biosynthesis
LALLWASLRHPQAITIATHANYAPACAAIKTLTQAPYWVVAHGLEVWNIDNPWLKTGLARADRILAVSHYTRDRLLQEQSLPPHRVVVLANSVDGDRFSPGPKPPALLQRYSLTPEHKILLTVARCNTYKGHQTLLHLLPDLRRQIPNLHYILVGKGSDSPELHQQVRDLQLQDCVTLAGFIPDDELVAHYNLCDVFAMPSIGEGFGIVYLEALACGKPVLAGNQDGAVDPLRQGRLGCLVDPTNTPALGQTLGQLLQGTHINSLLRQPQTLRRYTLEKYGLPAFRKHLKILTLAPEFPVDLLHFPRGSFQSPLGTASLATSSRRAEC